MFESIGFGKSHLLLPGDTRYFCGRSIPEANGYFLVDMVEVSQDELKLLSLGCSNSDSVCQKCASIAEKRLLTPAPTDGGEVPQKFIESLRPLVEELYGPKAPPAVELNR
jgi:hypothetical protein